MGDLQFRVLGPVGVVRDGVPLTLRQGLLIDLLAALLISPNRPLPTDDLVDIVWRAQPPAHPRAALHNAIARLRRTLDDDVIETLPHGYQILVKPDQLDILRFDELLAAASREDISAEEAESLLGQALELWRGRPLGNVESPVLLARAQQLTDRYLDACERWAQLCLDTGRHDAITTRLMAVAEAHPFREQLAGQLMLALYQGGRQADALAAYESLRGTLAEELGIDPGPALQELRLRILRADPALRASRPADPGARQGEHQPAIVPRQLPPDVPDFCGRDAEADALVESLTSEVTPGKARTAAISGPGGVGKTALAVHVAHQLAGTFDDGQLFAELNGVADSPAKPEEVLASLLGALGVTGASIPSSLTDRMTMYRSLVADRRLLIVLDNAASERQVRPLMPASPGCAVIVTSRGRLTGVAAARSVHLGVLPSEQALDLLSRVIGRDRAQAEASDMTALAGLCGGLPLALRIAGARLAARPHWPVAKLTGRLADARRGLNELVHGDLDVRASFALSYESLDPVAKAMLRRASLLDAPDFPAWACAALLDVDLGEAEDTCERLVDAQLLDVTTRPDSAEIRYRLHDLVRAFARERTATEDSGATRTAALTRAFGGWLALAERAHRLVYGGDYATLHGDAPRWKGTGRAVARAVEDDPVRWLDGERQALGAAVRQSAELGLDEMCWDLAWSAVTLYEARGYFDDLVATQECALAATEQAGNTRGRAAMLSALASSLAGLGRREESRGHAEESLRLFTGLEDKHGEAIGLYRLGAILVRCGESRSAIGTCRQGVRAAELTGDVILQALGLRELAKAYLDIGDYRAAAENATRSLRIFETTGNRPARVNSMPLHVLGEVYLRRGELDAAERTFRQVLEMVRDANDETGEAHVLLALGETSFQAGHQGQAEDRLRAALTLARRTRQATVATRAVALLEKLSSGPARDPGSELTVG